MTYTALAVLALLAAVVIDLAVARTRLVLRRAFWVSYAIIVFFQLVSNGAFTGFGVVRYDGEAILGSDSPVSGPPPFLGDGRIAFAPVEDLLFGAALVLLSLVSWVWWGRRGVQRTPLAGPPRAWLRGGPFGQRSAEDAPTGSDLAGSDLAGSDHAGSDHAGSDHAGSDQAGSDQAGSDQAGSGENGPGGGAGGGGTRPGP